MTMKQYERKLIDGKKSVYLVFAVACLMLVVVKAAKAVEAKNSWQETYAVTTDTPRLVISNIWGDVIVRAGAAGQISVNVDEFRRAPNDSEMARWQQDMQLAVEADDNGVSMIVDHRRKLHHWQAIDRCKGCRADYQFNVVVPANTVVEVSTVTEGEIDVKGVHGLVSATNVNGSVTVRDIHNCEIVKSVNGPVKVKFIDKPTGNCSVSTVNGNITVAVPTGSDLDVATQIHNGRIRSDFEVSALPLTPKVEHEKNNNRTTYRIEQGAGIRIGNGGPVFKVSSMNGDLLIEKN